MATWSDSDSSECMHLSCESEDFNVDSINNSSDEDQFVGAQPYQFEPLKKDKRSRKDSEPSSSEEELSPSINLQSTQDRTDEAVGVDQW